MHMEIAEITGRAISGTRGVQLVPRFDARLALLADVAEHVWNLSPDIYTTRAVCYGSLQGERREGQIR